MPTTSNFGWTTPADTDLVKDGASAIRTLGNGIDTSLVDLKGGTTGQILSKASNTDLDYTWINNDVGDITEVTAGTGITGGGTSGAVTITNSMATAIDAKGDLIAGTGSDAFTRLAVGSNGDSLVADSTTATGLRWSTDWNAGRNKIINGDFSINQRSFTSNTTSGSYNFDRFIQANGGTSGTLTITPQTFTLGTAPVTGYEGKNFVQCVTAAGVDTNTFAIYAQRIEEVRTFANQTITVSFWAKTTTGTPKVAVEIEQNFGTGGTPSSNVQTYAGQVTLSTSWTRYSVTVAVPSISGKTLGTTDSTSFVSINLFLSAGSNFNARTGSLGLQNATFQFWGVQAEAGSVATAFTLSSGSINGELAACQRYYWRIANLAVNDDIASGMTTTTGINPTVGRFVIHFPVTMRTAPTALEQSGTTDHIRVRRQNTTAVGNAVPTFATATRHMACVTINETGAFGYEPQILIANNTAAYLGWSAEL